MANSFFAGCESYMEDDQVIEAESSVTITPEEQAEEVAEAEETATETAETTAEVDEGAAEAEMVFRKFEEIDRMIAHVEKYGVDRAFLSICNHDNILNKSFNMSLPACESFDAVGSPQSPESIAALESLKETASKIYEFLKRMAKRLGDWIVRIVKLYDIRIARGLKQADALVKRAESADVANKADAKDLKTYDLTKINAEELGDQVVTQDAKKSAAGLAKAAKSAYEAAKDILKKDVPAARKNVAELNTIAATADDSKKEEAKQKAKDASENVKKLNKDLAIKVRNAGKFLSNAASLLKNGTEAAKKTA